MLCFQLTLRKIVIGDRNTRIYNNQAIRRKTDYTHPKFSYIWSNHATSYASPFIFYRFKTLEYLSCTDATQAWGFSKQEKNGLWGARAVEEMCCVRRAKPLVSKDDTFKLHLLSDAFSKLVAGNLFEIVLHKWYLILSKIFQLLQIRRSLNIRLDVIVIR